MQTAKTVNKLLINIARIKLHLAQWKKKEMADRFFVKIIEINYTSDLSLVLGKSHRFSCQGARKKKQTLAVNYNSKA